MIILGSNDGYWYVMPLKRDLLSSQMTFEKPFATRRIFSRQFRPMKRMAFQIGNIVDYERSANSVKKYISSDDWEKYLELKELFRSDHFNKMLIKKYNAI